MKIDKVTITGADDSVNIKHLQEISKEFPFVEWGILFSKNKMGQMRYPSTEWIKQCTESLTNLSAHFCGWYSREVLEKKNIVLLNEIIKGFNRVQLNYNFSVNKKWDIEPLIKNMIRLGKEKAVIFQCNDSNKYVIDDIASMPQSLCSNVHFLYDSSLGNGKLIERILKPFKTYTGYSGGIGPDNVEFLCSSIISSYDDTSVWIDMENGVRTENKFDLEKVYAVLDKSSNYVGV